jgi:hypothetical protein
MELVLGLNLLQNTLDICTQDQGIKMVSTKCHSTHVDDEEEEAEKVHSVNLNFLGGDRHVCRAIEGMSIFCCNLVCNVFGV